MTSHCVCRQNLLLAGALVSGIAHSEQAHSQAVLTSSRGRATRLDPHGVEVREWEDSPIVKNNSLPILGSRHLVPLALVCSKNHEVSFAIAESAGRQSTGSGASPHGCFGCDPISGALQSAHLKSSANFRTLPIAMANFSPVVTPKEEAKKQSVGTAVFRRLPSVVSLPHRPLTRGGCFRIADGRGANLPCYRCAFGSSPNGPLSPAGMVRRNI